MIRPRYWHTRALLTLGVLTSILITCVETNSLSHQLIAATGPQGWWFVGALAGVAMGSVADIVVNDLLPDRFTLPFFARYRFLVYMALGIGLLSISGVIAWATGWTWAVLHYWLPAGFSVLIAVTDLIHYHATRQATPVIAGATT